MDIFAFMLGLIGMFMLIGIGIIIGFSCAVGSYFRKLTNILGKCDKAIDPALDLWIKSMKDEL